jgi:hypothetical protein
MGPPQAEAPLSGERPERRLEVIDGATRSAARRSVIAARRASYLAFVGADELGRRQHVPLDRLLQLGLSRAGIELEIAVERVEAKDVTLRPVPPRWARPSVADRSESFRPAPCAASPSHRPPVPPSSPRATQWVNTPRGASGSSTSSASDRASSGTFAQRSGGETSSPSQVYRLGIACEYSKTLLSRANAAISR